MPHAIERGFELSGPYFIPSCSTRESLETWFGIALPTCYGGERGCLPEHWGNLGVRVCFGQIKIDGRHPAARGSFAGVPSHIEVSKATPLFGKGAWKLGKGGSGLQ